ncbi:MAG: hypothetical protein J0M05_09620 [Candidatus Kapabacteria bacterium]|nr:hypothetical protein [Candidatus Kapabacteria bacterium]
MSLTKKQFSDYITQFNFRELFNDMGWNSNNLPKTQTIAIDTISFRLQPVAEKSGFLILVHDSHNSQPSADTIPDYATRKKIEAKLTTLFQEHLIIFFDSKKNEQIWQFVTRQAGKPTKITETRWHKKKDPELLYQRASGIFFELDEEEHITIVDVTKRMTDNFNQNNEKVTKQFYDKFKKEHGAFLGFIKGIADKTNQEWYASLMLNRLMFCYFIQKKGFLDNNKNYLRDKLNACSLRQIQGGKKAKFYSFYRSFLLELFHHGLNNPNNHEYKDLIGKIPYLNGGLFDEHELEKNHTNIDIDDKAFERLFDFFDQYEWHLDTRHTASGKDINPDVIGYIFEKYINDRANMGAYYTKEDITDYISKNCIIPFLFDETKRNYPKAFKPDGELWSMVKNSGDHYIYPAVKHGIYVKNPLSQENHYNPLPDNIEQGIHDVSKRMDWNKPATADYALPTEIWREVVDRRNRYHTIKSIIDNGDIQHSNDFITYNLNIRQFAQDCIENTNDPDFLKHFYKALTNVTIIDPTCGSGAFLFAAMNILEPLYEACLQRMEIFIEEAKDEHNYKHLSPELQKSWKAINHEKSWHRQCVAQVKKPEHPNLQYFIYKSIILHNLYGVDIMKEAVEIAKLRLFLKLVATVEADYRKPNLGLEPLPDIDFNIRAGNTLVGFATFKDAAQAINERDNPNQLGLVFEDELDIVNTVRDKADDLARVFDAFKKAQIDDNLDAYKKAKEKVLQYQDNLNDILNEYLAFSYGIDTQKSSNKKRFAEWLQTHQPFHWFAEFYEIIHEKGGFDVIIGNPPYVEVRQISYLPIGLKTFDSGAVHSMCMEKSLGILKETGNISMIVPLALVCTQRMVIVQNLLEAKRTTWYSNFAWRPGKLFENVNRALTIFISNYNEKPNVYTTNYIKWSSDIRNDVFPNISYTSWNDKRNSFWIPKLGNKIEKNILKKILKSENTISQLITKHSSNEVYYRTTGGLYWKIFTNFSPKFYVNGKEGKSSRENLFYVKKKNQDILCVSLLSSNLFWWWYTIASNLRDLNPSDIQGFKFPNSVLEDAELQKLGKKYLKDLDANSSMLTRIQKQTGEIQTQSFKIALSKPIIDEIDTVLAEHYGFTDEELDFIINYDIKYRMGKELENEDEG